MRRFNFMIHLSDMKSRRMLIEGTLNIWNISSRYRDKYFLKPYFPPLWHLISKIWTYLATVRPIHKCSIWIRHRAHLVHCDNPQSRRQVLLIFPIGHIWTSLYPSVLGGDPWCSPGRLPAFEQLCLANEQRSRSEKWTRYLSRASLLPSKDR